MKPTHNLPDGEWLVSGGLIYRLRDGVNCDEINVAMVDGSRDTDHRHEKAAAILALLATPVQPAVEAASGRPAWRSITGPGQVHVGDKLRFTIGEDNYSETAKRILHGGTDKEEIIYNKTRNFYLITSMAMANRGSQKNVEFLASSARPVPPEGQEAPVEQSVWPQFTVGQWLTSKCFGPVEFNGMDTYGSEVSYMFRSPQYGMRYLGLDRLADNFDLPEFAGSRPRSAPEYDPETVIARLPEILSRLEAAHLAGRQHSDETGLSYAVRVMGEWDLPDAPRSLPVEALTDEQIVAVVDSYDWSDFEYSYDEQIKFARAILKLAVERG